MATVIYARGFPGCADQAVGVERAAAKTPFPTIFTNGAAVAKVTVNPQIMRSYEQLVRGDLKAQSFDFKERVIGEALKAFGTATLGAWIRITLQQPTVTQTHIDFIEDFIEFASNGRERRLPPQTWETLIVGQTRGSDKLIIPVSLKRFLTSTDVGEYIVMEQIDYKFDVFISRWLSNPTGFSDMVITLNTLFGDFPFHQ